MDTTEPASLRVSRRLTLSPEQAFDAWVEPRVASRWLFATPGGQIVRCDLDPRPGGALLITDRREGEDVEHVGNYVELDRPHRLVFRFGVPKYSSEVTTVVLTFAADPAGCEVTLDHYGVPREWVGRTEEGWRDLLGRLEELPRA